MKPSCKLVFSVLSVLSAAGFILCLLSCGGGRVGTDFSEDFNNLPDRVWIGRDFWAVPMEDWKISEGRLECVGNRRNMRLNLLTRTLEKGEGRFTLSIDAGLMDEAEREGTVGFWLGLKDPEDSSAKAACYFGDGIAAGLNTAGFLFIGDQSTALPDGFDWSHFRLEAEGRFGEEERILRLRCLDQSGRELAVLDAGDIFELSGLVALADNHHVEARYTDGPRFWFDNLRLKGSKIGLHTDNAYGPILWTMYTLSRGVMKMTAQLPPMGTEDELEAFLYVSEEGRWVETAAAPVDPEAWSAVFKVTGWDSSIDREFKVAFKEPRRDGKSVLHEYGGTIRKDPVDRPLVLGGMTCQYNYGFPYTPLVNNLTESKPDLLYFSGDQIYEANGGYGIIRFPADRAILNYLGKWYMFGWAFGDVMRDRPTICTPDDHDIFQGNVWGEGGKPIALEIWQGASDSKGGYVEPAAMVNVVHRTQCGHLPDPFDPTPMEQDIAVWYTDIVYGRVSFAVISDRIFKSGPERVAFWEEGRRDHVKVHLKDPSVLDKPGLKLIGDRQWEFLESWKRDWTGADMKVLLSQTLFAGVPTHHGGNKEFLYGDLDSGGWPQTPRDKLVDFLRRCSAFHICGDQHVPFLVQYGLEGFQDSGWAHCTPAITVGYQRRFHPDQLGWPVTARPSHDLPNTGAYTDEFGNKNYVFAVGNPEDDTRSDLRYMRAHLSASGYSVITFDQKSREITIESFRFLADVADPGIEDNQFPGWPLTISQFDCAGLDSGYALPTLELEGLKDAVVEVIREDTGKIESIVRITGSEFIPKVYKPGTFTLRVGDPEMGLWKEITGVGLARESKNPVISIQF